MISASQKRILDIITNFMIGWFVAVSIWELISNARGTIDLYENLEWYKRAGIFLVLWLGQGSFYGIQFAVFERFIYRRITFNKMLAALLSVQFIIAFIVLNIVYFIVTNLNVQGVPETFGELMVTPLFYTICIYSTFVNFLIGLAGYVDRMLGKGNLRKFIIGEFYKPRIENKVFMFLDLKGSTRIAEGLPPLVYSQMIQDCFKDLSIVDEYHAQVYQYVGDEVVLIWEGENTEDIASSYKAYFAFQEAINCNKDHYLNMYGVVPEFKGGMHIGDVTAAQVGEIKLEIAYHGDTINTASRIENKCNSLDAHLLVSKELFEKMELDNEYIGTSKGSFKLKGKDQELELIAIEKGTL